MSCNVKITHTVIKDQVATVHFEFEFSGDEQTGLIPELNHLTQSIGVPYTGSSIERVHKGAAFFLYEGLHLMAAAMKDQGLLPDDSDKPTT